LGTIRREPAVLQPWAATLRPGLAALTAERSTLLSGLAELQPWAAAS
jgi:hypothetical protein